MSTKGNWYLIQFIHCQLPLNIWKVFLASFILLHFTCTLELQLKQGIPGFDRERTVVQTEQLRDMLEDINVRLSSEYLPA